MAAKLSAVGLLGGLAVLLSGTTAAGEPSAGGPKRNVFVEARWLRMTTTLSGRDRERREEGKADLPGTGGSKLDSAKLTVREGTRGTGSDGTETTFRSEVKVKDEGALALEVAPAAVFEGARIEALPTVSADGKKIRIQLKLHFQRVAEVRRERTKVVLRSGGKTEVHVVNVEHPVIESTKLDTEVELPDGGILMLEGRSQDSQPEKGEGGKAKHSNLAVMVTAKVVDFGADEGGVPAAPAEEAGDGE